MTPSMLRIFASLGAGLLFGVGLVLSGMTDPAKVVNFLDIAGTWDASLMFVMGAAVIVAFVGFRLSKARGKPLFADSFPPAVPPRIDLPLVAGALLFGAGWGLAGFCPGPAVVSISLGDGGTLMFVSAMLAGMWAGRQLSSR